MATIVKMPTPRARTADAEVGHSGATILFFTGVRYERDVEVEADDFEAGAAAARALSADDAGVHAAV